MHDDMLCTLSASLQSCSSVVHADCCCSQHCCCSHGTTPTYNNCLLLTYWLQSTPVICAVEHHHCGYQQIQVCSFSHARDIEGSQYLKVGYVIKALLSPKFTNLCKINLTCLIFRLSLMIVALPVVKKYAKRLYIGLTWILSYKSKVPHAITSIGLRADPDFLAMSLQVTWS